MKLFLQSCVCALLLALTSLALCAIVLVHTAATTIHALPGELDATRTALLIEVQAARHDLLQQAAFTRRDLLERSERQVAALRLGLLAQADQFRDTADRRLGDTLSRADTALAVAENFRQDIKPVLDTAHDTLFETRKTVADLHPQLLGLIAASKVTAGETAQTMRDFRGAVPGFLAQGQVIAGNVQSATLEFSGVANNLNHLTKPKWYDRLIGYGLNGVVIYRNLNPVTSLTVKGAQILTSRP